MKVRVAQNCILNSIKKQIFSPENRETRFAKYNPVDEKPRARVTIFTVCAPVAQPDRATAFKLIGACAGNKKLAQWRVLYRWNSKGIL